MILALPTWNWIMIGVAVAIIVVGIILKKRQQQ
jgi:hypothetical protein